MDIQNLFLGKALEDIDSCGKVELNNVGVVNAKNLLGSIVEKDRRLVAVKSKETNEYYIYSSSTGA